MKNLGKALILVALVAGYGFFYWVSFSLRWGNLQFGMFTWLNQSASNYGEVASIATISSDISSIFLVLIVGYLGLMFASFFRNPSPVRRRQTPEERLEIRRLRARLVQLEGRTNPVTKWFDRFQKHVEPTEEVEQEQ